MRVMRAVLVVWSGVFALVVLFVLIAPLLPYSGELAYTTDTGESNAQTLQILDVGRRISTAIDSNAYLPSWSDDGSMLVYLSAGETVMAQVLRVGNYQYDFHHAFQFNGTDEMPQLRRPKISPENTDLLLMQSGTFESQGQIDRYQLDHEAVSDNPIALDLLLPPRGEIEWISASEARFVTISQAFISVWAVEMPDFELREVRRYGHFFLRYRQPVLSPDGNAVVVPAVRENALAFELYRFEGNQIDSVSITDRRTGNDTDPGWSSDGEMLAHKMLNDTGYYIIVTDDIGQNEQVIYNTSQARVSDIVWSGDGKRLAFLLSYNSYFQLCVITIETGHTICPVQAEIITDPVWRP